MTDNITNKDYITITDKKVMVGGKETTTYHGQEICMSEILPSYFKNIQQIVKDEYGAAPIAMCVLSSETDGKCAKPGTPSAELGKNAWVRFMFANGFKTPWVFTYSFSSASDCADHCAIGCGRHVQYDSDLRSGLFGPIADKIKQKATQTESPKVGQLIEMDFGNCIMQLKIVGIKEKAK